MYSILDLLEEDGIKPRWVANTNGGEYASPCPGCGGKDRFRSWPLRGNGGRYWCRQCGKSGDLIQYLRDFRGMGFRESCHFLGHDQRIIGNCLHLTTTLSDWKPVDSIPPNEEWQKGAISFLKMAEKQLWSSPNIGISRWLKEWRGLKEATLMENRLGWNPRDIYSDPKRWGKEDDRSKGIWIPSGLVIPCFRNGSLRKISIRRSMPGDFNTPPDRGGKYVLVSGSCGRIPMVLGTPEEYFVVVESDLDAIYLHQEAGDIVCTISMGSANNRPDTNTTEVLRRAQTILVALDTDEAGKKSAWSWWMAHFPKAKRWPVPGGKDPGEAYEKGINLRKWIRAGLPDHIVCLEDLVAPTEDESPSIEEFL